MSIRVPSLPLAALAILLTVGPAEAQGAADRVFPPGGRRGTTVSITFPGFAKVESAELVVDGPGVKALGPFVKGAGQVEIAPDAEPGVRQIRLVGPQTATAPRPFAVGVLPEAVEQEPNDALAKAQRLEALPLTLSGAIPKPGDTDSYRVTLKKGDFLVVASESRRLAGPVYLDLRVRDERGRTVPVDVDVRKRDPVFTCAVPADGDYTLQLADVTSNMGNIDEGCQYRVHLTTGPWLDFVTPPSVGRGASARLAVHGWNLEGKAGPGSVTVDLPAPSDAGETIPVAAGGAPNRLPVWVFDGTEAAEAEPNDARDRPQDLPLPAGLHGTFEKRGDVDVYRFTAKAKETLRIDVTARDWDSLADPRFALLDASGKTLLTVDDADRSRDPSTVWTVPADGAYTLVIQDLAGGSRGGPSSYYRLTVAPVQSELSLVAKDPTLVVKPGAKAEWSVTVYQSYQPEEITLRVEGLPPGVTAEPVKVAALPKRAGQSQAKIVLNAAADAKPGHGVVRIVATTAGASPLTREAAWMHTGDGGWPLGTGSTTKLVALIPAPDPPKSPEPK